MSATNFRDVFIAEDDLLRKRRSAADVDQTPLPASQTAGGENVRSETGPFPRTGLAISGGGIRSASFGLGFLQAMYRHGVLRQVDFLSTVSGGSFVGCYLSTSIADREQGSITLDPSASLSSLSPPAKNAIAAKPSNGNSDSGNGAKSETNQAPSEGSHRHQLQSVLPLLPKKCGANTDDLNRLSQAGKALNRPLAFFNRLLLGMLLINVTAFSGIIALAALFAVAYRSLYDLSFQHFLNEAGFVGDLQKPWFPAAVLLPIWLFTSWMSRQRTIRDFKMEGRWQHINRGVFLLLTASIFMAMASLLTVADPSVPLLAQGRDIAAVTQKTSDWMSWLSHIAVGAVFAALIPYLSPTALIRSGTDPKSPPKYKWIFNIASRALLYGMPLVVFGLICRENISGYQEKRADRYEMAPMSVTEWHSFWRRVDREASGDRETGSAENPLARWYFKMRDSVKGLLGFTTDPPAPQGISQHLWETMTNGEDPPNPNPNPKAPTIWKSILLSEKLDKRTQEQTILKLWNPAIVASMWNPFTLKSRVEERSRNLRWREQYIQQLNAKCLSDPGLHRYFHLDKDSQGEKRNAKFIGLREHALDLESTAEEVLETPPFQAMLLGGATESEALAREIQRLRLLAGNPDEPEDDMLDAERKLNQLVSLQAEIRKTNWDLLKSHYGDDLRSYDTIFSYVVLAEDQKFRLMLAAGFGLIFLVLGVFLPLNGVSVHSYYRQQLGSVWLNPIGNTGGEAALASVDTVSHGFPYQLINATLIGSKYDTELFIFSPKFCGSYRTGFVETSKFDGGMNITDAMAVSGAAITPFAAPNPLVRVLLLLANFRLGQWLPNPARKSASHFPPAPLPLLWSMFRDPDHGTHCFVTDGGLADNTGIASLLHRRCRVIIAVDASQDEESHFHDLLRLLSTQRTEFGRDISGVTFTASDGTQLTTAETAFEKDRISLELLQSNATGNARSHYVVAKIHYTEDRYAADAGLGESLKGYLIYVKPSFDGDEPTDLVQYRDDNSDFPHDPTYDQFFNSHKFQSYQRLGKHIGEEVWEHLLKNSARAAKEQDQKEKRELITPWLSLWEPFPLEPQAADPLDRLRKIACGSAPFQEKFQEFQVSLEHPDLEIRKQAYSIFGDYLESHPVDHPDDELHDEERQKLWRMLIGRYHKEQQEDIMKTITGLAQQCGVQARDVKEFLHRKR